MGKSAFDIDEIIAAQATPKGEGHRGIIRVSGPGCFNEVEKFFNLFGFQSNRNETFIVDSFFSLQDWGAFLPATIWYWPEGRGYTGQESLEIHIPGSSALIEKVLQTLFSTGSIRSAHPGEFTLRAFLAGRLDLTQAEAVLAVIDAKTDDTLITALKQLSGNLSKSLSLLRENLIETLAHLEAGFDFVDEDISFISSEQLLARVQSAERIIDDRLKQITNRSDHQQLPRIILTGYSNSGKSSLFNRLVHRKRGNGEGESAIVSNVVGTTRDYLEEEIILVDHKVLLTDTAGLSNANRPVSDLPNSKTNRDEFESKIRVLTREILLNADLCYQFMSAELFVKGDQILPPPRKNVFIIISKVDLLDDELRSSFPERDDLFLVSSQTDEGIEKLCRASENLIYTESEDAEMVQGTVLRCRDSFLRSLKSLQETEKLILNSADETLIAYELRLALDDIGKILGVVHADDILDSIFSKFCIGK